MAFSCPRCGKKYDVLSLESGEITSCQCGQKLDLSMLETVDDFLRYFENKEEMEKARLIQAEAQQICRMILDEKFEVVDIEIAKENLKQKVEELFPDKMETYRMIYESRFNRLWDQFRGSDPRKNSSS